MAGGNGPWGGGKGPEDEKRPRPEPRGDERRGQGGQIPELDQVLRKGQERLRVIMGGGGNGGGGKSGGDDGNWLFSRQGLISGAIALGLAWSYMSFYQVKPEEMSVELFLGKFYQVKGDGLNLAPWPIVSAEIVNTSQQRTTDIGSGAAGELDNGLMLTGDQNIVDIEFQVVWNVSDPAKFLFNLAEPEDTIRAVAESAVRDIVARSQLAPILNKNRGEVENSLTQEVQSTLDSYDSGISVVRVNLLKSDVPAEVADAFRAVQAAHQALVAADRSVDRVVVGKAVGGLDHQRAGADEAEVMSLSRAAFALAPSVDADRADARTEAAEDAGGQERVELVRIEIGAAQGQRVSTGVGCNGASTSCSNCCCASHASRIHRNATVISICRNGQTAAQARTGIDNSATFCIGNGHQCSRAITHVGNCHIRHARDTSQVQCRVGQCVVVDANVFDAGNRGTSSRYSVLESTSVDGQRIVIGRGTINNDVAVQRSVCTGDGVIASSTVDDIC